MNTPYKEQCKCGHTKFNVTHKSTGNQYECQRCKVVYIMTIKGEKK